MQRLELRTLRGSGRLYPQETQVFDLRTGYLGKHVITFLERKENMRCPHEAWRQKAGSRQDPW